VAQAGGRGAGAWRLEYSQISGAGLAVCLPMAYKDIDQVMAAQHDLVEPLVRFEPRLLKMAPSGEPPED